MQEYTLASLVDRVQDKLNDLEFSEDQIKQFINDTYFDVIGEEKYPFLEKIDEFTEYDGGEVGVPRDYQATINVVIRQRKGINRTLVYASPDEYFGATFREPFRFTVFANQLHIKLPTNHRDFQNDEEGCHKHWEVKHYYLAKPQALEADTDAPVIPYEFSEILVLGALARAEQRRDNFDFAAIYENKQTDLVNNMKVRYGMRQLGFKNRARLPYRGNYTHNSLRRVR